MQKNKFTAGSSREKIAMFRHTWTDWE